jgi:hypothetical protein
VLKSSPQTRIYRTYEDWQAEQKADKRSPEERGIRVGSPVMWRHKHNGIIVTDRAIVLDISGNTLHIQVKDVKERKTKVDISEIVISQDEHLSMQEVNRRTYLMSQADAAAKAAGGK